MKYWSGNKITKLKPDQVFVFGSNPEGRHGAGAAKVAMKFGAVYGNGRGLQGQSYALVTKNLKEFFIEPKTLIYYEKAGERSVSVDQIKDNIFELYECALTHPDKEFLVAYTYPSRNLNGYSCKDMYDMFMAVGTLPNNILFNESFKMFTEEVVRPTEMKLIVAGGRDFKDFEYGFKCIDHMTKNYDKDKITIVCGRALGGDECGRQWYLKHKHEGVKIEYFVPEWENLDVPNVRVKTNRYGKKYNAAAGMTRNHLMGDTGTHLIAFHDLTSKGTADMISYMRNLSKPVKVFTY